MAKDSVEPVEQEAPVEFRRLLGGEGRMEPRLHGSRARDLRHHRDDRFNECISLL